MLSKKTKYAFHALTFLAENHGSGPVRTGEIASKTHIPKKFLENILLELKKAGIVFSKQGKSGGYYLLKDPEQIKLAQIIRMFNGPIALLPCVSLNYYEPCDECEDEVTCGLNKMMINVRDEMLKILENRTISDIARMNGPEADLLK